MIAALFPGQRTETNNMFDSFDKEDVRNFLDFSSRLFDRDIFSILKFPPDQLSKNCNSQVLVTVYSAFVIDQWRKKQGPSFDLVAGHSVGEYSACFYAGIYTYEKLINIIKYRIHLFEECETNNGYMISIPRTSTKEVEKLVFDYNKNIQISNYNSPIWNTISGSAQDMDEFVNFLKAKNIYFRKYEHSIPFHTTFLKDAGKKMCSFLKKSGLNKESDIPIVSCFDGNEKKYREEIIESLSEQIYNPVLWTTVLKNIVKKKVGIFIVFCSSDTKFQNTISQTFPDLRLYCVYNDQTLRTAIRGLNGKNINHLS